MLLQVQFKDFNYRYVDARTIDRLFANKTLRPLSQPSEERRVNDHREPIKKLSSQNYCYNQQGKLIKNTNAAQSTFEIYV